MARRGRHHQTSVAAAEDKLASMREMTAKHTTTNLRMPDFRTGTEGQTSST